MLEKSLKYPLQDSAVRRFGIAYLLYIGSLVILPAFILTGYMVRAGRNVAQGDEQAPSFSPWGELFVLGLKVTGVAIAYLMLPILLVFVGVFIMGAGDLSAATSGVSLVLFLVAGVTYFVSLYMVPAASLAVDIEGRLSAAFDVSILKPLLLSSEYLIAFGLVFVLSVVSGIVTNILAFTIIGLIMLPPVAFYFALASYHILGNAYGEVHSPDEETPNESVVDNA